MICVHFSIIRPDLYGEDRLLKEREEKGLNYPL